MAARRYLIVGPAWVGDMVMAQSLFITLREQHPDCLIDVLAPGWSLPLLTRIPEVRKGIDVPITHGEFALVKRWRLGRALRAEHYDHALVLPRSFKAALIPFFAKARIRTGYRGEMRYGLLNDIRPLDKNRLTQTVQRFVALGHSAETELSLTIPAPHLRVDRVNQQVLLQRFDLKPQKGLIALLPGAEYGPAKQWPAEHFATLAGQLHAQGRRVVIIGSQKDNKIAEAILKQSPAPIDNLCGQTSLTDAIDLIAACDAAISNDSGLMHIAAAVNTPLVAIYGSSSPTYTPPLSNRAVICYRGLECSPCFKRTCPLGHTDCLHGLAVEQVIEALAQLLREEEG